MNPCDHGRFGIQELNEVCEQKSEKGIFDRGTPRRKNGRSFSVAIDVRVHHSRMFRLEGGSGNRVTLRIIIKTHTEESDVASARDTFFMNRVLAPRTV